MPILKSKCCYFVLIFMPLLMLILDKCSQQLIKNQPDGSVPVNSVQEHPLLEFTFTPVYKSFEDLRGQVLNINPLKNKIMVFIKVGSMWRIKPGAVNQFTPIRTDGSWICDITTAENDHRAAQINAFLLPDSVTMPPFAENDSLPPDIYSRSLASMEVLRSDSSLYRIVTFSDYQWSLRECDSMCGSGPNYFSASPENVWLDPLGFLHLKITRADTVWNCAEVIMLQNLGYGTYQFQIGKIDRVDKMCAVNLFTWDEATADNHRQIDIALSSCAQQDNNNIQYDLQPDDQNGNRHRFNLNLNQSTTHSFTWSADDVYFESDNQNNMVLQSWTYQGFDLPVPGNESPRINLWLCNPDSAQAEFEVVIQKFEFDPLDIN
jgi:hypothetical protein